MHAVDKHAHVGIKYLNEKCIKHKIDRNCIKGKGKEEEEEEEEEEE